MSLTQIFQEKVPEIFDFIKDDYGFKFEVINDYRMIARKEDMNLYFIFDREVLFSVEIEVTGALGEKAIKNPNYRRLGASTMAECMKDGYQLKVRFIQNKNVLISEMKEEARVLREYCGDILSGDVSDWERIVGCLQKG
jgi:hypothetical protein